MPPTAQQRACIFARETPLDYTCPDADGFKAGAARLLHRSISTDHLYDGNSFNKLKQSKKVMTYFAAPVKTSPGREEDRV